MSSAYFPKFVKREPLHPNGWSSGTIQQDTMCDMLACYEHDEPEEWDKYLPFVTFAYNTEIQSTLKECPFYLFFGGSPLLPNDIKINSRYDTRHDDRNVYAEKSENAKKLARNLV